MQEKMDKKVSVIVPVYNTEKYLEKCISSITAQTYSNLDIVIVNDASEDDSLKIIERIASNDNRIKIITTGKIGAGGARNVGIDNACGDYLMFVDSDDWIDIDCIEKCMEVMLKKSFIDCVMFPYIREYGKRRRIQYTLGRHDIEFNFGSICDNVLLRKIIGMTNDELCKPDSMNDINGPIGKLCNRKLFADVRYPRSEIIKCGEDGWFNSILFVNVKRVLYIATPFYHYNKTNEKSLVHSYHDDLLYQYKNQWSQFNTIIGKYSLGEDFREALNNRIACSCLDFARNILNSKMSFYKKVFKMKSILNDDVVAEALDRCSYSHMEIKWKFYYMSCKYNLAVLVLLITIMAERLKSYLR